MAVEGIKALTCDVFGTVVDWRSSVIREGEALGRSKGLDVDWVAFADAWRGLYQPSMEEARNGSRPWTTLDDLHRESLVKLIGEFGITGLSEEEIDHFNRAWHRLDPWPDAVEGLTRLKEKFILATLSNGNIALLVNLAKWGRLPWDAVLGAEPARHFKHDPEAYLQTAGYLGLAPEECMMVAAHNSDLTVAAGLGFRTAFVIRPIEHGPRQTTDLEPAQPYDYTATDMIDLAKQLGC